VFDVGTGAVLPVCHHEDPRWLDRLSPSLTCCLRCGRVSSDLSNRLSPECLSFASLCSHAPALHAADHHGDDLRECDLQALREVDDEDMMDSSFDSYSSSSSETAFTSGLNISTSTQSDHDSSLEAHPFEAHRPSALVLPSATGFSTSMSSGTTTSSSSPPPSFPSTPSSTSGRLESISEVYADLLRTERRQLRHSHYQAPQSPGLSASPMSPTFEGTGCLRYIKHRRVLVDWITEVCESHHMCRLTIHWFVKVSIFLLLPTPLHLRYSKCANSACLHLDRVLSRVMVARNRLQLVATACILIAAKFNENEQRLPTLGELTAHTHNAYSTELIKEMELMVLGSIEWTVKVAVPIHFLEYFFEQGLLVAGDCVDSMPLCAENFEQTRRRLYKYLQFFCDCCQQGASGVCS
jgi:hypothetical protein